MKDYPATAPAKAQQSPVKVTRFQNSLLVAPACQEVQDALRSKSHVAIQTANRSFRVDRLRQDMFSVEEIAPGELTTRATMEPVVRQALAGRVMHYSDMSEDRFVLPSPELAHFCDLDPPDWTALEFVRRHDFGILHYEAGVVDPVRLVAQIALAWPEAKMAVVTRTQADGKRVAKALREYGLKVSVLLDQNGPVPQSNLVVATFGGLAHSSSSVEAGEVGFDISWAEILIAMDGFDALGRNAMQSIGQAIRARTFAMLPIGRRPSPLERDQLAYLFGFEELIVPRHGCREREVRVIWTKVAGGSPITSSLRGAELKRKGIWRHALRNRRIARLAQAIARGDRDKGAELVPAEGNGGSSRSVSTNGRANAAASPEKQAFPDSPSEPARWHRRQPWSELPQH